MLLALGGAGAGSAGPESRGQRRRRSVPTAAARVPPASHAGCGRESPAPLPCFALQPRGEGKGGCRALSGAAFGAFRQEENTRLGFWGRKAPAVPTASRCFCGRVFTWFLLPLSPATPLSLLEAGTWKQPPPVKHGGRSRSGRLKPCPPGCRDQATSCVHHGAGMERAGAAEKFLQ